MEYNIYNNMYNICIILISLILIILIVYHSGKDSMYDRDNNHLSVIITASHIQSHPSIKIIKEVIESLHKLNIQEDTPIILAHDYADNDKYHKYFENLEKYININNWPNMKIVMKPTHGHLTGSLRYASNFIDTEYVLVLQHDLPFINSANIYKIIEDMKSEPQIRHVRFNKRRNILNEYDKKVRKLFGEQIKQINYTYTKTGGWSDQNFLVSTNHLKNVILKDCKDGTFMEQQLMPRVKANPSEHERYGTYLFGPLKHKRMIKHCDGKHAS